MDSSAGAFSFPSSRLFSSSILLNAKKGKSSLEGLIVRTLAGQVAEVLVDLSGSVLELQKRIFKHLGVPVEGQVIFFKGKKLSSSAKESLKKLGVVAGDSIVLTFSYAQYRQLKSKKTLDISSSQRSINNRRIKFLNVDSMGKGNKSSLTRNVDLDEFIRLLSTRDRESSRSRDLSDNLSDLLRRDTEESFLDPESKVSEAEHGQLEGSEDNKSSSSESTDNEEIESSAENEANELDQDSGFVNERMAGVPRANLNQRNFQLHQSKLDELVAMGFSENGAKRALAINK